MIYCTGVVRRVIVIIYSGEEQRPGVAAVRKLNDKISKDCRVRAVLINIGDGYTLCTKQ